MKYKSIIAAVAGFFLLNANSYADESWLNPIGLMEDFVTGPIIINDKSLTTKNGLSIALEQTKKKRSESHTRIFYKIVDTDSILLCEDKTEAHFIEAEFFDDYETILMIYQSRINTNGKKYIAECGEYRYTDN